MFLNRPSLHRRLVRGKMSHVITNQVSVNVGPICFDIYVLLSRHINAVSLLKAHNLSPFCMHI